MNELRRADGTVKIPYNCFFEYVDKEGITRKGKGRIFVVNGQQHELFPMGVLCGVLGRHRRAIYKWEKNFGFPPALWRVRDDRNCNRWYSRKQLIAMKVIYEKFGCLRGKHRNNLKQFITAVRAVFFIVDRPIEERNKDEGNSNQRESA